MPAYRIYRIGGDGRFSAGEWIEAADDASAMDAAASQGGTVEVWQGSRLVGRVGATESDSDG